MHKLNHSLLIGISGNVHQPGEKNRRLKIMAKKSYSERNLKFETLQLHVGQETPAPEPTASAATPPSNAAILFSKMSSVGFVSLP